MKWMLLALFIPLLAHSGGLAFNFGINPFYPGDEKVFSLSTTKGPVFPSYSFVGGIFTDKANKVPVTGFIGINLGTSISFGPLSISSGWGPTIITQTDYKLSTLFQFNGMVEIMLVDTNNNGCKIGYMHISNAGLRLPNHGRDYTYFGIVKTF